MSHLFLLLFLLKVSKTICDQACDCEEIKLLKEIVLQNMLDQKLETSRLFAKIRRLEAAQNAKPALVAAKGIENAATLETMETMYRDMERMSKDMERMHKDMHSKFNQSLNTEKQGRSSIIKMGLKAEKQKKIELSSKLESQLVNVTETLDKHKVETIKMVEQCKSNINSLKDVFEQDVNSTLFKMLEQINVNHEFVSSDLVSVKHHLDKNDVMISRLNDMTFRNNADGGWAQWGTWSSCSVTCGGGIREKTRTCTNPEPSVFGRHCDGNSRMIQECNNNICPVDGNWAEWTTWSGCDVTCGSGTQTRTRTCTNPAPKFGGLDCVGSSSETKHCITEACPNHGGWSQWSPWGSCSVTCDIGMQSRDRSCSNPYPSWNGDPCYGDGREDRICMAPACADGAWSTWGSWGSCSESCGGGVKSRLRTCTNPRPSKFGKGCEGSSEQVVMCNKTTCSDHKVSFLAYGSTTETDFIAIKFPAILFDYGNGYSSSTGRFTSKIPGIYNFAVTLTKRTRDIDFIEAFLRLNEVRILQLYSNPDDHDNIDYGSYSLSMTGNFYLHTNDYVDVESIPNNLYNDYSTSFTGVLVIPDY